jgi:hypothetical protein
MTASWTVTWLYRAGCHVCNSFAFAASRHLVEVPATHGAGRARVAVDERQQERSRRCPHLWMPIERRRNTRSLEPAVAFEFPGVRHRVVQYRRSAATFGQGAECVEVMYLQQGSVKLSVRSSAGSDHAT